MGLNEKVRVCPAWDWIKIGLELKSKSDLKHTITHSVLNYCHHVSNYSQSYDTKKRFQWLSCDARRFWLPLGSLLYSCRVQTGHSKLALRLCCLGERREQQANLCLAFLTAVFLGHVFFDTSPSSSCLSAHKTRYCAGQTWHVLWVWLWVGLYWAWGEAQITSSLQVVDLLCFLLEAQRLQTHFPCPGRSSQAAVHLQQLLPFCSQSCTGVCKGVGGGRCKEKENVKVSVETKWGAVAYLLILFFNNCWLQV